MRRMPSFVLVPAAVACGGNAALPSAQSPAPPPSSAAPSRPAYPRLEPVVIQQTVRASFARFRICYEDGLRRDPNLRGQVKVKFVIDRGGLVTAADDVGSTMPDASVIRCVLHGFRELGFPKPSGGVVTVVYPINFVPDDEPDGGAR